MATIFDLDAILDFSHIGLRHLEIAAIWELVELG